MKKEKDISLYEVDELSDELDIYFNEVLSGKVPIAFISQQMWRPNVDLYEDPQSYHLVVELGGVDPSDINIEFQSGLLRIHGKRSDVTPRDQVDYQRMEICAGPFERRIRLRSPVDPGSISATYERGLLRVEMKKTSRRQQGTFQVPLEGV
jgi:HSP20 family protein